MSLSTILDHVDAFPLSAGVGVSATGWALTLAHMQSVVGVIAGIAGIVLTVATLRWRQRENRWRRQEHLIKMQSIRDKGKDREPDKD